MNLFKTLAIGFAASCYTLPVHTAEITGAGSTFAAPVYAQWAHAYRKASGVKVNYQGIGSSAGLKQIIAKTVDFAASDTPLTANALSKAGLLQFPTIAGGVVPVVNVPGIQPGEMVVSGQVLGDIYLGKTTKWNDPEIIKLNPALHTRARLPDLTIAVVRRADGSGTSALWTHYVSQTNAQWKKTVGEGATVSWPAGIGGKGNDGVAAFVGRLKGAIGYIEWSYAKQNKISYVRLRNPEGAIVAPNVQTFKAALERIDWTKSSEPMAPIPRQNAWPHGIQRIALLIPSYRRPCPCRCSATGGIDHSVFIRRADRLVAGGVMAGDPRFWRGIFMESSLGSAF